MTSKKKQQQWAGEPAARYGLLIGVSILCALGLIMAFSASSGEAVINQVAREAEKASSTMTTGTAEATGTAIAATSDSSSGLWQRINSSAYLSGFRQAVFIVIGLIAAVIVSRVDYRRLAQYARPLTLGLLGALAFLVFFGDTVLGSARWINLGLFTLQPSEFAKPILLLMFAGFWATKYDRDEQGIRRRTDIAWYQQDWVQPMALVAACILFVLLAPDFGSTTILCVGLAATFIFSDGPWFIPALGGGAVAAILASVSFLLPGYTRGRMSDFIMKWTLGETAHQTLQAEYALGSGGITGLGPGLSRQKFRYLPEAQNDFIIAVIGEEMGLIGVMLVLIAFVFILIAGLHIASRAQDRLGRAVAGGATVILVFQALLNTFAVVSLGPVTGKPLPFVALGGSSMISSFLLVGLIYSVARFGSIKPKKIRVSASSSQTSSDSSEEWDARDNRKGTKRRTGGKKKRSGRTPQEQEEVDEDEDDLEWRWDRGAHLSGPGARR